MLLGGDLSSCVSLEHIGDDTTPLRLSKIGLGEMANVAVRVTIKKVDLFSPLLI